MQYKTELHVHTCEVSPCADLSVEEVTERYIAAGYTTLVLTNHYTSAVIDNAGQTWEEKITHFLSGYRRMKEYAGERLHILLGVELRFEENANDYLVYGADEAFLISHPDLHKMTLKTFSSLSRANGLLLIQAHPFRNRMTVMNPKLLDGFEVFNGHCGTDSRNYLADAHARRLGMIRTSGSDFHHADSVIGAGILTAEPILSSEQLLNILRGEDYGLICEGPVAEKSSMYTVPAKY